MAKWDDEDGESEPHPPPCCSLDVASVCSIHLDPCAAAEAVAMQAFAARFVRPLFWLSCLLVSQMTATTQTTRTLGARPTRRRRRKKR